MDFGSQLYVSPIDGWDAYINFVTSNDSGTEIDLTTTYQASGALLIGLNVADRTRGEFFDETNGSGTNFFGVAGYLNYAFSEAFALGARVENFTDDQGSVFGVTGEDTSVTAFTLSGNIGSGPLKLIPEFRFDTANEDIFLDVDDLPTGTASQFVLGAYYAF